MTLKNTHDDERKKYRTTTYLSESENIQLRKAFKQSPFDNFSQYHRHLITKSISEPENTSEVQNVNESTSYALSETVQTICRFLTVLEKISSSPTSNNDSEVINLINTINANILYIGDLCYRWAKWYRKDAQRRQIIKDIAELTLNNNELQELAKAAELAEVTQ